MAAHQNRMIDVEAASRIGVTISNRSTYFAAYWLELLTGRKPTRVDAADIVIVGPGENNYNTAGACKITLWDYQVGHAGSGHLASAISGAATVIGQPDGPPIPLPVEMPEKWCGAHGAMLALAECCRQPTGPTQPSLYDVSAADILRSFCLQNSGGPTEMVRSWRRNGRFCIEHGGIFPMGFFACKDGHVAILGRSRRDWKNIRSAVGDPVWAKAPEFDDPFALARDSAKADALLECTLAQFSRDELLARGISNEAVIAPVYNQGEAHARNVFRSGFIKDNMPGMPFTSHPTGSRNSTHRKPSTNCNRSTDPAQPLAGLRVIELCWIWSGPMVGQLLADLGAEVIKIESLKRFDLYRTRGLEAMRGKMDEKLRIESSLYFHSLNRNKIGLSLDLKSDQGQRALKDLAARSHLLIENFTVGTLDRLGLGTDVLAKANPSLIQLSMSGPGRGSSVEHLRSYGLVLSALAGAEAHITSGGEFVGSPTFSISDPNAAIFAALAALAAVLHSRETGTGLAIDLSQIEAAATLAGTPSHAIDTFETRKDTGGRHTFFEKIEGEREQRTAPVLQLEETDDAPQFADCSGWLASTHPITGNEHLVAAPWRINCQRPELRATAPALGSGNDYVLGEILGWSDNDIKDLQV